MFPEIQVKENIKIHGKIKLAVSQGPVIECFVI